MSRYCANCGTEVDDTAVFCPTCGQPIDPEAEAEIPPAPAWPDPEPRAVSAAYAPVEPERAPADDPDATRPEPRPSGEPAPTPPPASPPAAPARPSQPPMELPVTMPVTLSGWLIGGGAALAALGALISLFDGIGSALDAIALVALLAVAASVFLVDRLPHVPQLRLVTLAIVLVAFGIALDRIGLGRAGAGELLLFLGTAAAAIGAILLETGRDQPLGGPSA